MPTVPLFSVMREHAYTGRFYHDVVEAGPARTGAATGRRARHRAPAAARFQAAIVYRHGDRDTHATCAGQFHDDVVEAGLLEQALQLAAGHASGPQAPVGSGRPQATRVAARCADVWVHSLLRCELAAGHDLPHMAAARGYWRPARWVRERPRPGPCIARSPATGPA